MKENDKIRSMTFADIPAVMKIEKATAISAWPEKLMRDCIKVGFGCWVLECEGQVKGYAIYVLSLHQCHLLTLSVEKQLRGQGYGAALLTHCIQQTQDQGIAWMVLEVRPSNVIGQSLYTKFGFKQIGVKKDYYNDHGVHEDALVFGMWVIEP